MLGMTPGLQAAPARWFDELDSTNAEARRLAELGEGGPVWIAARRQTAGRGRRGRAWESAPGNLAATLLAVTELAPAEAAQLSFVTALAVADLACAYVPDALVGFKWPNDVLVQGAKASGILIESGPQSNGGLWLAIGVGVNLVQAPADLPYPATTLAAHLRPGAAAPTPDEALTRLIALMAARVDQWRGEGFSAVRRAWLDRAIGMGAACTARLGDGAALQGVAEGLDIDGALLLRMDDGQVRRIAAGDVFFGSP